MFSFPAPTKLESCDGDRHTEFFNALLPPQSQTGSSLKLLDSSFACYVLQVHKKIVFACDLHLFIFYLDDEIVTLVCVPQIVKLLMM